MDGYLIWEFPTQEDAQACLNAVNASLRAQAAADGYEVSADGIVGKNAATGQSEPGSCRTTTWAEIAESPDGTFWFVKPPVAVAGDYTERDFPAEWIPPDPA